MSGATANQLALPIIDMVATQAATGAIATGAISGLGAAAFLAPIALVGIIQAIIGPPKPHMIFTEPQNVLPNNIDLTIFGERFRNPDRNTSSLERALKHGAMGWAKLQNPTKEKFITSVRERDTASSGTEALDEWINFHTLGELSLRPSQAARSTAWIEANKIATKATPPRRGGALMLARLAGVDLGEVAQANAQKRVDETIIESRNTALHRALKKPGFASILEAFAAGLLPGAELPPQLAIAARKQVGIRLVGPASPRVTSQIDALQLRNAELTSQLDSLRHTVIQPGEVGVQRPTTAQRASNFFASREVLREVPSMPVVPTNFTSLAPAPGGFFNTLTSGISNVIQASTPLLGTILPSLLQRPAPQAFAPIAMPGGAPIQQFPGGFADPRLVSANPASFASASPAGNFLSAITPDFLGAIPTTGGACISPTTSTTTRLPSRVDVPTTDANGNMRMTTFKNMGHPVLWSGDLAAVRRVKRIATRVRRATGGRR